MILIFDYFETLLNSKTMDFNRGLKAFWAEYYEDLCEFEDMKKYGEDLFCQLMLRHKSGEEFPCVKEELPLFAAKFGGSKVNMSAGEEADFLMLCNEFVLDPGIENFLKECSQKKIPMYVLSNSGFSGGALMEVLNRFGIGKFFGKLWSSADFGRIKPCRDFFELAITYALDENPNEDRRNIVFIGDIYETDVVGAYDAGIESAWLNKCDGTDENGLATYICTSSDQLSCLLQR